MEDEHWGTYESTPDMDEANGPWQRLAFRAEVDGERLLFTPPDRPGDTLTEDGLELAWTVGTVVLGRLEKTREMMMPCATGGEMVRIYLSERLSREMPEARVVLNMYGMLLYQGGKWHADVARDIGVEEAEVEAWTSGREPPPPADWIKTRLSRSIDRLYDTATEYDRMAEQASGLARMFEGYRE